MYQVKKRIVQFATYYRLDFRSLAIMRVALALVILIDLFFRAPDLMAFYSDKGLWPSAFVYSFSGKIGMWSLCTLFKSTSWIILLFCLNVFFAFTFLIGYKTKWSNLCLWILTLSFQNRNIYILQGGDDLLRLLLFWGLFLPWHKHLSLDKKHRGNKLSDALANLAYLVLIASVYLFSALLKTSIQWHTEASAIYHALSLDAFRTTSGNFLLQYPTLLQTLTHLVYWLEIVIPLLILWPSKNGKNRILAFILIFVLHISFGLFLNIGLFFIISICAGIGLLPIGKYVKNRSIQFKPYLKSKNYKLKLSLKNTFVLCCLVICVTINVGSLKNINYQLKKPFWTAIYFLRLDQYWGMFSPGVPQQNNWLVYQAYNAKGQQYDIFNDQEYVSFDKPAILNFSSDRWRKLNENVQNDLYGFLRPHFCKHILKTWNKKHKNNVISTLNLYSMEEKILLNSVHLRPTKKILCVCDGN